MFFLSCGKTAGDARELTPFMNQRKVTSELLGLRSDSEFFSASEGDSSDDDDAGSDGTYEE